MNADKAFFDTNVLLYMYSSADRHKQAMAQELFEACASSGRILLSTQVVQEFYVAGARKFALPRRELREATVAFLELPLVKISPSHILLALEIEQRHQVSFWDALILAAAESGGAGVLYTEDLNDGQTYGSVQVQNPFRISA